MLPSTGAAPTVGPRSARTPSSCRCSTAWPTSTCRPSASARPRCSAARVITTLNAEGDIVRIGGPHLLHYGARTEPPPPALPEEDLGGIRATATAPRSPLTSSLYRDLVAGQSTEVEHLFGDLVAVVERVGVPAPLLGLTTTALRVHQARAAG